MKKVIRSAAAALLSALLLGVSVPAASAAPETGYSPAAEVDAPTQAAKTAAYRVVVDPRCQTLVAGCEANILVTVESDEDTDGMTVVLGTSYIEGGLATVQHGTATFSVFIPELVEAHIYVYLSAANGTALASSEPITIVSLPTGLWEPVITVPDEETRVRFSKPVSLTEKASATVNGVPAAIRMDSVRGYDVFIDKMADIGDTIVISGVKYPTLFPSYSFKFTLTYGPNIPEDPIGKEGYILVTAANPPSPFQNLKVKGILQNGLRVTRDVDTIDGVSARDLFDGGSVSIDDLVNAVFAFTVNADGSLNLSRDIELYEGAPVTAVTKGKFTLSYEPTLLANSKTVFVVKDGSDYSVYTGIADVVSFKNATTYIIKDGNRAVLVYAVGDVVWDTSVPSGPPSDYVYILSDRATIGEDENGNRVYFYEAIVNGNVMEIEADGTGYAKGLYCNVPLGIDAVFRGGGVKAAFAPVTSLGSGVITANGFDEAGTPKAEFAGAQAFIYSDNTKVFVIDGTRGYVNFIENIVYIVDNPNVSSQVYVIGGTTGDTRYDAQVIFAVRP